LRRRYVVERGLYACGCEVLRGYGNCIIAVAFGGVVVLRGCACVSVSSSLVCAVAGPAVRFVLLSISIRVQGSISARIRDVFV
jgi:hypothetical protein